MGGGTPTKAYPRNSLQDRKSTRLNSSHDYISYALFFFNDTATTEIYTLSLHDALPIYEHGVKATFFALGWVAEHQPKLIREIHCRGHEVACHGYNHQLAYDLSLKEFHEDIRKSKSLIEDVTSMGVIGYRAASYSVIKRSLWVL